MKMYFSHPTQVVFADPDNAGEWISGIAYQDEIICSCCGGIFSIEEVIEMAFEANVTNPIYEYENWEDITYCLVGGTLPQGLERDENGNVVESQIACFENIEDEEVADHEANFYKSL